MTKDYGEILLEAMSTLLTAATQPKAEDQEKEKTVEKINTADPLTNFLPNHSQTFTDGNVLWSNIGHNTSDNLLAINCVITTKKLKSVSGSFGLTIALYGKDADKPYGIVFDSSQMIGNIYNFISMPQRLILSIPNDMEVLAVSVKSYNNTNDSIKFDVNSITLSFGQDLNIIGPTLEPFVITCADSQPRYTVTDRGTVVENPNSYYRLEARYVGKRANGNYYTLTPSNKIYLDTTNTSVRWYRYFPKGARADKVDNWGGAGWEYLENLDGFELTCKPPEFFSAEHEVEKFKAVFVSMNLETGQPIVHTSNIIEIVKEVVPTEGFINGMRLVLEDGTSGSYPFYESDGYIRPALMAESAIERVAKCEYDTTYFDEGKTHSEDFFDYLDTIEWVYSPWSINFKDINSGSLNKQEFIDNNGYGHIVIDCFKPSASKPIVQTLIKEDLDNLCQFKYTIPAQRSSTALGTDKIECYIYFSDGKQYTASRGITLSQLGNSGTDYTIVTRLFSGSGRLAAAMPMDKSDDLYYIECDVYNPEGKRLDITDYSLITSYFTEDETTGNIIEKNIEPSTNETKPMKRWLPDKLSKPLVINIKVTLKDATSFENTDEEGNNSNTATNPKTIVLQDIFIVPLCASNYKNHVYRGASKIIYNSEGSKPMYDKSFLELLPKVEGITWKLEGSFTDVSLNPEITKLENNYIFTPVGTFDKKLEDKNFLRIQAISNTGKAIWDQPIVFSQNKHFSAIIDAWDGRFQINEEGNYIMSSAYVAGGKNEENKFTGLVMGELATIEAGETTRTDKPKATETGLFGYREGAQSFGFKTDGTAFLGESGSGRINFDGNGGVIYSGNFDGFELVEKKDQDGNIIYEQSIGPGTQGTFFNLTDGSLITSSGKFRGDLEVEQGNLAGWKLTQEGIYRQRDKKNDDDITQIYAGINSNTTTSVVKTSIGFILNDTTGQYYSSIGGVQTRFKYQSTNGTKSKTTWEIPARINNKPLQELKCVGDKGQYIAVPANSWTTAASDFILKEVRFDDDIKDLTIQANFFKEAPSLENIYLPAGVKYIGENAFPKYQNKEYNIYLRGNPGVNWGQNWWGSAKVYYSHTHEIQEFNDLSLVDSTADTKLIRFFAGTSSPSPSINEWKYNNKDNLFLVTDEGETYIGKAYMKSATVINASVTNLSIVSSCTINDKIKVQCAGAEEDWWANYTYNSITNKQGFSIETNGVFKVQGQASQLKEMQTEEFISYPGIVLSSSTSQKDSGKFTQIKLQITAKSPDGVEEKTASLELDYYKLQKLADLLAD